ncbi:MAG: hypothetical protein J6Y35_07145 [Bacteroidales bacterium]|nr:hypothetical protein [Bacteroidales bacterium]
MDSMIILRHAHYAALPNYIVQRDGHIITLGRPAEGERCDIILDGGIPLLPAADGKFYPVRNTGSGFAPDILRAAVTYFYEYCQQNRWRGFIYYERYSTAQLAALERLLLDLCHKFRITNPYGKHTWQLCPERTTEGTPGIYTDASFCINGPAVHPQPELINLLKSL